MKLFFVFIAALLGATTTVTLTSAKEASAPSRRLQSRRQRRASRDSSDAEAKAGAKADDMSMPSGAEITVTGAEAEDKVKGTKGGKATDKFRGAAEISALTSSVKTIFSPEDINGILPHRYPFLLVDKVVEYEQGKRAVGIKSVTLNEPHFTGHFPDRPMMPGVLRVEALAQLAGIVCLQMEGVKPGAVFFFAGVDGVKWKKPIVPGDTLVMEVEITKWISRFGIAKAIGRAYVDGEMAVELEEMTFAIAK